MSRKRFSTRAREAVLARFGGCCAMCRQPITPASGLEFDHVVPLALGGEDIESNLQPLCSRDHKLKTAGDVGSIRKADRQRAVSIGTKAPSPRPIPRRLPPPKAESKPRLPPRPLYRDVRP